MDLQEIKNKYPEKEVGRAEDLTGKIFNNWKVLYRTLNNSQNKPMWVCECQCEKHTIKPVYASYLKNGSSTGCGCLRMKKINEIRDKKIRIRNEFGQIIKKKCSRCNEWLTLDNFWKNTASKDGYGNECKNCQCTAKENRYNIYKKGAKKRGLDFTLSKEEFYDLTSKPCEYCGELQQYNGIDRIDSTKGYNKNNCVPCCEMCNKMKLDYSKENFINHIEKIYKHTIQK